MTCVNEFVTNKKTDPEFLPNRFINSSRIFSRDIPPSLEAVQ